MEQAYLKFSEFQYQQYHVEKISIIVFKILLKHLNFTSKENNEDIGR